MGSSSPNDDRVFILNTETEQLEFVGESGPFTFQSRSNGNLKLKGNKILSVVYRNDTGVPALIEFNKGDTNHIHHFDQ